MDYCTIAEISLHYPFPAGKMLSEGRLIIYERIAMHSEDDKRKLNHRLRRVVGQVEAVNRMIEEDAYCVDILMQLSAATGALGKVGQIVLENHLKTCVAEAMEAGPSDDRDQKLEELLTLFRKYASVID